MSAPAIPSFEDFKKQQPAIPTFEEFSKQPQPQAEKPAPPPTLKDMAGKAMAGVLSASQAPSNMMEGIKGAIKGSVRTVYDPLSTVLPMPERLNERIHGLTEPSNAAQTVGSYAPDVAMALASGASAIKALPSTARAGANFAKAMQAAKDVPVDVSKFAQPVLRAKQINSVAGDPMAPVLRKAFGTIMPTTEPLTYENARILASSAGRKAQQTAMGGKLTGEMGKRLSETARGLDEATAEAAQRAGVGDIHNSAMKEYRNAMRLKEGAKTAAKIAVPAAVGGLAYKGIRGLGYLGD